MSHCTFMFTLIILSPSRSSILLVNDMWIFAFLLHPTYHSWLLLTRSNFQFPSDDHFLYNFILHIFSISLEGSNYRESTVFKKVKGRGGRGIFYLAGAAYWGQGCFLNMSTYQTCMVHLYNQKEHPTLTCTELFNFLSTKLLQHEI